MATPHTAPVHTLVVGVFDDMTRAKVAAAEQAFPDCGGGWQIYWRQSMPGLGNRTRNADGTATKNWWPLLFY